MEIIISFLLIFLIIIRLRGRNQKVSSSNHNHFIIYIIITMGACWLSGRVRELMTWAPPVRFPAWLSEKELEYLMKSLEWISESSWFC
jgi:hypothetical protein